MNRCFSALPRVLAGLALLFLAHTACAGPLRLALPIACNPAHECFIQQYFDHDPSTEYKDYACGRLAYDGHTGTDFRVRDLVEMRQGVEVLAAAPGRVRAVRDGMDDVNVESVGLRALKGRFAGNSVVLVHEDGSETQYSHLKKGSVRVRPGDQVLTGQVLGLVGLSGRTEFPHLEFAVRVGGEPVDPFRGLADGPECGVGHEPLWTKAALAAMPYKPTHLLAAGFSSRAPTLHEVALRQHADVEFSTRARALVYWVRVAGLLAGDVLQFSLSGPDGTVLARHEQAMDHSKAQYFQYVGKRRGTAPWPRGEYVGRFVLKRQGASGQVEALHRVSRARVTH